MVFYYLLGHFWVIFNILFVCFQNNSLFVPFKRTSSNFGSRLWSELPLPIDECHDTDYDFNHLPELRKKKDAERILRVNSLQVNVINKMKPPLARHISSPMRFNYEAKPPSANRLSDTSFSSFGSKISFSKMLRRMSSKRRTTMEKTELFREKRKSNKTTSIRLINNCLDFPQLNRSKSRLGLMILFLSFFCFYF